MFFLCIDTVATLWPSRYRKPWRTTCCRSRTHVAVRLRQKAYALEHGASAPEIVFPSRLGTLLDHGEDFADAIDRRIESDDISLLLVSSDWR